LPDYGLGRLDVGILIHLSGAMQALWNDANASLTVANTAAASSSASNPSY
jgi:hypothetical protein